MKKGREKILFFCAAKLLFPQDLVAFFRFVFCAFSIEHCFEFFPKPIQHHDHHVISRLQPNTVLVSNKIPKNLQL
jgi:hypothetical protein